MRRPARDGALRHRRRHPDDEGFALITTVLAMAVLAAFSLVVLQQTITNTAASRKDQDWVAALAAAQAGLDDYVNRLNDTNGGYYTFTTASPDPGNPAMGFTSGKPNWAPVPLATTTDAPRGSFHYDVENTGYTGTTTTPPNGNLVVESTGRVGQRTRTVRATVRRSGFVDYVYFTDFETPDPLTYGSQAAIDAATTSCTRYHLPSRSGPPTCQDIVFRGDKFTGPVHSNDTMLICDGNQFLDAVTTGSPKVTSLPDRYFRVDAKNSSGTPIACAGAGTTTYQRAGDPAPVERISIPSTNLALKRETSSTAVPRGCLFVGPTKITILGTKLRAKSPWTKSPVPGCPADDTPFDIPKNGVVYVDVVPSSNSGDPNAPLATEQCDGSKHIGYPTSLPGKPETNWTYPCKAGDVFIEQASGAANALDGRLTVSANNNLYVTGSIDYAGGTSGGSFLGLIAEQFLWFWHPVHRDAGGTVTNLAPLTDLSVSASLLSLNHTIGLQNPAMGPPMGTLKITGALTQKYRGSVGVTSGGAVVNGYGKDYRYDQRLRYDAPPRFLNPLISTFSPVRTAEKPPAYR